MKRWLCLALVLMILTGAAPALAAETPYNWYEVFVYSFKDSDGDGIGDLQGLISKLDYIHDLGFRGLWLMPVMPSPSYHKYDVTDYLAVDPQYGDLDDLGALVTACRQRDIRLIVDLPLNHTSTLHPWFIRAVDMIKAGRTDDPALDYYRFTREPGPRDVNIPGTDWHYEEQFSGGGMPDLNLDNPLVRQEIRDIMAFWLLDCGVDGFRLDAVTSFYTGHDEKNIAFLRFLKNTAEELKPGSFLVGECWAGLEKIAEYYQSGIDSFFLFPASQAEGYVAGALRARRPAESYVRHLSRVLEAIPKGRLAPFLSNHDTGRAVGLVQGRQAPQRVKFAHALISLMGGLCFTYYGEEIGMAGAGPDPNKRLGMYWQEGDITSPPPGASQIEYPFPSVKEQLNDPDSLLNYIKKLNACRLALPAVALGETAFGPQTEDSCVLIRSHQGDTVVIAVNFSPSQTRRLRLPGHLSLIEALDTGSASSSLEIQGEDSLITLLPYGIAFLR